MRVLIGCEYSGTVREAFRARGHDAMSCDLLPTDVPGPHYQGDVFDVLGDGWDLAIFHPPCTRLTSAGAKHLYMLDDRGVSTIKDEDGRPIPNPVKMAERDAAVAFVRALMDAPVDRIALENPAGMLSSLYRKPDQYIEPWQHGHGETKKTGLWLKGLPLLEPSNVVEGRSDRIHKMGPSPDRWKLRSTTYPGIAAAMADQWGGLG
jgi:hypothetical protein